MESTEVIIARLVLGYLKDERCRSSYKEFLKSSHHLQDHKIPSTKYIPTRFLGLTLGDILTEYFEISQIVQGRLESTSYYDEHHPKTSLIQQVLYLLNRVQSSRASTPCPSSCRSPMDSHTVESSPSHREHTSDVDTTPAHTLPGNVQYESEESVGNKTPKRNGNKYTNCLVTSSSQTEQDQIPEVIDTEELAKTLLENTELHEKIARTINKVAEKQHRVSAELDKTIKTVVKETERDPIFDKIIDEIIGSSLLIDNNNKGLDTLSMTSDVRAENIEHKQRKAQRDSDHQNSELHIPTEIHSVDQGNRREPQTTYGTSVMQQTVVQQTVARQDNNEVIFFNGPLEKYLGSTTNTSTNIAQPQPMQTPVYLNTTCGGLLIPSGPPTSQIVLLNQPSPAPWQVATPYLSEHDIMSMPTVIVNDPLNSGTKKTKHILPTTAMPTIEIPNLSEFINFHPKVVDNNAKKGLKKVIYPVTAPKPNPPPDISTVVSHASKESSEKQLPDLSGQVVEEEEPEPIVKTPPPLEITKKTTPRSGSHVRNLDFSTPPKITSTHKKNSNGKNTKVSQFVHKKQAAKSLFKKEGTIDDKSKEAGKSWDADLRAAIPETSPSKGKRNFRTKRKPKKAKLNTTAQDAALLEAALQTPVKKTNENQEETKEKTAEEPSAETLPENKEKQGPENKTVLSPSKLNNSKKNIMNVKDGNEKFVTPELTKESTNCPIKANRNITPMLETPLKDQHLPKTPGVLTPGDHNLSMISNFTPFTKMLEANLKGFNIDSIPTPSMPITPNFPPFTPTADLISPYSNRPTDYSTGSSYYLPSDNEQNKSLEARLKEEEKKQAVKVKDSHLEIFNKNVIGKKNLSLMKRSISSPSSCSDSSSDKDDSWGDKGSNDTIIFNKKETPRNGYSLRKRKVPEATKKKNTAKAIVKNKPNEVKKEKLAKAKKTPNEKKDNKKEVVVTKTKAKSEKEHSDAVFSTSSDENALIQEEVQRIIEEIRYVKKEDREKVKNKQVEVMQKTPCDKEASNNKELKESGPRHMEEIQQVGKTKTSEETTDTGSKTNIKPKEKDRQLDETKQMAEDTKRGSGEAKKTSDEEEVKENSGKSRSELIELMQITFSDEEASDNKVVEESKQKESTQGFDKSKKTSAEKKEVDTENKTKTKPEMKNCQIMLSTLSNEKAPEEKRQTVMEAKKVSSKVKKDIKGDIVKPKTKQFKQTKLDSMKYIGKAKKTSDEKIDKKEDERKTNTELIEVMQTTSSEEEASITEVGKAVEKKEDKEIETKHEPEKQSELVPIITNEKTLMLMELEEKRQRTIQAMQKAGAESSKPAKPQRSRKFKIKPILNVTCGRKKLSPKKGLHPKRVPQTKKPAQPKLPEKPMSVLHSDLYDSDESDDNISLRLSPCPREVKSCAGSSAKSGKTEHTGSDVEAHNLIEGLKERGIHLMMNKSPKKKIEAVQEKAAVEDVEVEDVCSSTSIVVMERETFDKKLLEGEDLHIVFDDTVSVPSQNDLEKFRDPSKSFVGKVYFEEIDGEVDVVLKFTDASIFFDMPSATEAVEEVKAVEPSKKIVIQEVVVIRDVFEGKGSCRKEAAGVESVAATDNVIDDDLMDFAATGNDEPKTSSPKSTRKRKLSEDGKENENAAKRLLKRVNVDMFLNNIHADTNFHVKK